MSDLLHFSNTQFPYEDRRISQGISAFGARSGGDITHPGRAGVGEITTWVRSKLFPVDSSMASTIGRR
jgi:hypothetical protein